MLAIASLASKFRAVTVHGPVVRAVAWLLVTGAVLLVCRQFWPRYSLSCIRHPSEARPGGVLEDVDCSFQRVRTLAADGSWAVQAEGYFLELKNVTVHKDGTRWSVTLNAGTIGKRVDLAAFATEEDAQALAKPLEAFIASCEDVKHRDQTLVYSISSDSSWTAGVPGIVALVAAVGIMLGFRPGREVLELSASTGTASLTQSSLAGAFVAARSFPLERVIRVGIAPTAALLPPQAGDSGALMPPPHSAPVLAAAATPGHTPRPQPSAAGGSQGRELVRMYLEVMDAVTGEGAVMWRGPAALRDDADVSVPPCRALSGGGGCLATRNREFAAGVTLADAAAAANHWLRSYADTGVGVVDEEDADGKQSARDALRDRAVSHMRMRRGSASRLLGQAPPTRDGQLVPAQAEQAQEGHDGCSDGGGRGETTAGQVAGEDGRPAESPATGSRGSASTELDGTRPRCVICRERAPTTALVPCRHLCLCQPCSHSVHNHRLRKCPVCRAGIESVFRVVLVT
jgi:hypothetical protein